MYDYHTHTAFSDDCDVPMEEMISSAISRGIRELAITDHYDPGYEDPEFPFIPDFDAYHKALLEAEKKYKEQLTIVKGLEIGIMDSQLDECRRAVNAFSYDFIIGSFHCLGKKDLYRYDFSKVDGPQKLEEFYLYVNRCLKEYTDYDIVGHLTIIDRYIGKIYDYSPYMDIIEDTLKTIIYNGKGLEINTSSFKYGTGIWLPREEALKLYRELGGEILTFGSDSHDPKYFRDHFDEAHELAKSLGFRYECTFRSRKPEFHKL
ncbi:histidinol-phosphatase HisJ family protein [bacterium 210820-DFI.6.37]|nr:histidinol-phosphatase HisJ family protein [bacterium 210820-DFI.6.37]